MNFADTKEEAFTVGIFKQCLHSTKKYSFVSITLIAWPHSVQITHIIVNHPFRIGISNRKTQFHILKVGRNNYIQPLSCAFYMNPPGPPSQLTAQVLNCYLVTYSNQPLFFFVMSYELIIAFCAYYSSKHIYSIYHPICVIVSKVGVLAPTAYPFWNLYPRSNIFHFNHFYSPIVFAVLCVWLNGANLYEVYNV